MKLSKSKNLIKLFYTLNKTPIGETGCLSSLYYLLAAQAPSFLIHPPFLNTGSQETFRTLLLTVQYSQDTMSLCHHWSRSTYHPTLSREAEDFPRGGMYPEDVLCPHS